MIDFGKTREKKQTDYVAQNIVRNKRWGNGGDNDTKSN